DANKRGILDSCCAGELRDSAGRIVDGVASKIMRLVKTFAEPGLFALFENRDDRMSLHNRDQQLHGIGPDINDSTTNRRHSEQDICRTKKANERKFWLRWRNWGSSARFRLTGQHSLNPLLQLGKN